jgi:CO dehydrogenase nickel-insertion accessory protein CooC1
MARLSGTILSDDESFKAQLGNLLRLSPVPVLVADGGNPDIAIVDGRGDLSAAVAHGRAAARRRRHDRHLLRGLGFEPRRHPALDARGCQRVLHLAAGQGRARRRHHAHGRAPRLHGAPQATTMVFFGAKGGAGTTTMAVNSAVEISRLSKRPTVIVDLKPGLGEVSLFLGVRSRYTLLDALDNLHRLDGDFLRELVVKHKSGLEMLAGSDLFDRPGPGDSAALEEVFRLLGRQYEYIVIDAGSQMNPCSVSALYTADMIGLVANPDVPCVRNAQRLLDRIGQLGPCAERVKILLNRAAEPYPIPPAQLQSALGQPIFHTVPERLQSGLDRRSTPACRSRSAATPRWRRSSTRSSAASSTPAPRRPRP